MPNNRPRLNPPIRRSKHQTREESNYIWTWLEIVSLSNFILRLPLFSNTSMIKMVAASSLSHCIENIEKSGQEKLSQTVLSKPGQISLFESAGCFDLTKSSDYCTMMATQLSKLAFTS